jgi:hypothetical protein
VFLGGFADQEHTKVLLLWNWRRQRILDGLAGITALIKGESHRQVKSEIRGNACYNLALDLLQLGRVQPCRPGYKRQER